MYLTLGQAAKKVGKSKGTLSNMIKNGKLSVVDKTEKGYQIDPSELFRVFPQNSSTTGIDEQSKTPDIHSETYIENIKLKAEIDVLQAKLEAANAKAEIFEQSSNDWQKQAQTLLLEHNQPALSFWQSLFGRKAS